MLKIPLPVIHYGRKDPETHLGGVEAFARNLGLVFEEVTFMFPRNRDVAFARENQIPVICDNQCVLDWPDGFPVIGFQHGVAAVKAPITGTRTDRRLAEDQERASRRKDTLWVACAEWISRTFDERFGNKASQVIYHAVDVERFDGRLTGERPRLILHDGRTTHKGKELVESLQRTFTEWQFEPLNCPHDRVPDRMREARAFVHLSRYEGNSIVCNEAMAMDLPCLFTRVGLLQDQGGPADVFAVEREEVENSREGLERAFASFAGSLETREYHPRTWIMEHATPQASVTGWTRAMRDFERLSGWYLGLP